MDIEENPRQPNAQNLAAKVAQVTLQSPVAGIGFKVGQGEILTPCLRSTSVLCDDAKIDSPRYLGPGLSNTGPKASIGQLK
ncbi:hypothetical protein HJFPF1_02056 [Paramyrothecium foliicola]|nr:hypothetical protein HJFPF1_02056 [Paramyrothecium foliicola]